MTCAWKELLAVLPVWMRHEVDTLGSISLQELRLRRDLPPELVFGSKSRCLNRNVTREDLLYTVNAASQYSPWATASVSKGYITVKGGHRIGICGETVLQQGSVTGIRNIFSLCIRIARDFPGVAAGLGNASGSVLILGPPGWGKTTLLRDLIRQKERTERICVVDERAEVFPEGLVDYGRVDVLSGCSKREGIPMLVRTMGPSCIAVDEITDPEDVLALLQASNCGIRLMATAHAGSVSDLQRRSVYRPLLEHKIFDTLVLLKEDKSYTLERMEECV